VKRYREAGYDFLAITDHNSWINHASLGDAHFTVLSGSELGLNSREHTLALGIDSSTIDSNQDTQALIDQVVEAGGLSCLNHVHWSAMSFSRVHELKQYQLIEIFNHLSFGNGASDGTTMIWDDILRSGRRVFGIATDDTHREHDLYGGWIQIWSDSIEERDILSALRDGNFYSTEGPTIESITVTENTISVATTEDVESICFIYESGNQAHRAWSDERKQRRSLRKATFDRPVDTFVRCQIRDSHGKRAWSNPIFPER
jgi:hypothetical protein